MPETFLANKSDIFVLQKNEVEWNHYVSVSIFYQDNFLKLHLENKQNKNQETAYLLIFSDKRIL